jgi:hypothetical protein
MTDPKSPPGVAVDSRGGAVIDPTKNVEDLVKARDAAFAELRASDQRFLDAQLSSMEKLDLLAREAEAKFQNFARDAESKLQTSLTGSETRRIDQLAENRQEFQNTIRDMLAESVRTTSTLVSTQLVQIQATFDTRVSKLEAFQWQSAGRSSVADPALASALAEMATSIQGLTRSETKTDTRREGFNSMGAIVVGASILISSIIGFVSFAVTHLH